jgi:hypothetical protein
MVSRERLPGVVAARFANRWLDWIEYRRWDVGAACLLPNEDDQVAGVRVWLALSELARQHPDLTEIFTRARERERAVLRDLDLGVADRELDLVLATVEGLRVRLCEPEGALTVHEARSLLIRLLELLGPESARAA